VAGGGARYQPPGLPGAGATRGVFFFLSHCCSHVLSQFTWASLLPVSIGSVSSGHWSGRNKKRKKPKGHQVFLSPLPVQINVGGHGVYRCTGLFTASGALHTIDSNPLSPPLVGWLVWPVKSVYS
jgi:hypothetical protein